MCSYGLIVYKETPSSLRKGRLPYVICSWLILLLFATSEIGDAVEHFLVSVDSTSPIHALQVVRPKLESTCITECYTRKLGRGRRNHEDPTFLQSQNTLLVQQQTDLLYSPFIGLRTIKQNHRLKAPELDVSKRKRKSLKTEYCTVRMPRRDNSQMKDGVRFVYARSQY